MCAPSRRACVGEIRARARRAKSASSQTCSLRRLARGIVGEKFEELVFEDAGAAWLEKDERQAGVDLRSHAVEDVGEIGAGAAAGRNRRAAGRSRCGRCGLSTLKAGAGEDRFGGGEGLRMVVVVPGVGPQEHLLWASPLRLRGPKCQRPGARQRLGSADSWATRDFWKLFAREARELPLAARRRRCA